MARRRDNRVVDRPRDQRETPGTCHHPKSSEPFEIRLARLRSVAGILRLEGGPAPSRKFLGLTSELEGEPAERASD